MAPRRPRRFAVTTLAAVAAVTAAASGGGVGVHGQPAPVPPSPTPEATPRASRPPVPVQDHESYLVSAYILDPTAGADDADAPGGGGGCPTDAAITSLDGWKDEEPLLEGPAGLFSSTATVPAVAVRFGDDVCGSAGGPALLTASWSVTPARGWRSYRFASAGAEGTEAVTSCGGAGGFRFRSLFFDVDEAGERLEVEGVANRCVYVKVEGGGGGVSPPPVPPVAGGTANRSIDGGVGNGGEGGGSGGGEGGEGGGSGGGEGGEGGSTPTPIAASPTPSPNNEQGPAEPTANDEPACFPASATVELADGSVSPLSALPAGSALRVAAGVDAGAHSAVYGWSHRVLDGHHTYVRLSHVPDATATAGGTTGRGTSPPRHLLLSPGHLLYVDGSLVPARSVRVGDALATPGVPGGTSRVVATGTAVAVGKVNPHTLSGDLLVDGVRVSSYTEALPPAVAHALLAPVRAAFRAGLSAEPMGRLLYRGVPGWRRWWA